MRKGTPTAVFEGHHARRSILAHAGEQHGGAGTGTNQREALKEHINRWAMDEFWIPGNVLKGSAGLHDHLLGLASHQN